MSIKGCFKTEMIKTRAGKHISKFMGYELYYQFNYC